MVVHPRSISFGAIGTSAVLKVTDPGALEDAHEILRAQLDALDRTCSRFREDSDLVRASRNGGRWTTVDPLLIEALDAGLRAAELTDGDVDPTLGQALALAGYDRDWDLLRAGSPPGPCGPAASPRAVARVRSGWRTVELDPERSRVRIPPGIQLDLGATAKAWAADRASEAIHSATHAGVLVSLGGDIATAGASPPSGWRIHVTDDHRAGAQAPGQTIAIASGGLATSSVAARRWRQGALTMHHIIDPSTSHPADGPWRTVSVAAGTCLDANIATTASIVRGARALEWLERLGLPARLVRHGGATMTIGGWPEQPDDGALPAGSPDSFGSDR